MRPSLLLLAAFLPSPLLAQYGRDSVITISVNRSTRMLPDRASLNLVVEGAAETSGDAIARGEAKLKAVTEALRAFGSAVKVDPPLSFGVGPNVAPGGYPPPNTPPTSVARSVLRVQVERLDQMASIVAAALAAGAATSSSVTFELSQTDSVRRARIHEALQVARLDAEAVATALGARLGGLVSVSSTGEPLGYQPTATISFDNRFGTPAPLITTPVFTMVSVQYRIVR